MLKQNIFFSNLEALINQLSWELSEISNPSIIHFFKNDHFNSNSVINIFKIKYLTLID